MAHGSPRTLLTSIVLVALITSQVVLIGAPGFGVLRKKKLDLQVRRPAVVRLANTSLAVRGKATDNRYQGLAPTVETSLETELVGNERSLVKKPAGQAEWTVDLTITGYSTPMVRARVEQVKNSRPVTYNRWKGSLAVAYQVVDKNGRVHDADNVTDEYDQEFQANAPQSSGLRIPGLASVPVIGGAATTPAPTEPRSPEDVQQVLVRNVVQRIAAKLGNTVESIEVQLAGGEDHLDRSATFLEQRLWARAVEELEKTPAFTKPEDESYRQYNLGLAYEAMSYDSDTYSTQRANLFKAQEHYDRASELNPSQRYFVEVIARTRESIARYRTLDAMGREDQKDAKPSTPTTQQKPAAANSVAQSNTAPSPTAKPASQALTVNDVIELRGAGVPDAQIIELIRASPVTFALDRDTLLAIAKAKVPVPIQNELRVKAGLPPLPATPAK